MSVHAVRDAKMWWRTAVGNRWFGGPRVYRLLVAVLMLMCLFSYSRMISGDFLFNQFNHDDTESYVALGHSLANGRGYTRSLDPAQHTPHQHFPPGFPILLAAGFAVSSSVLAPQLVVILSALVNPLLFWFLARRWLTDWLALAATALSALANLRPVGDRDNGGASRSYVFAHLSSDD